jgi:Arc/MetJ family transcription regulator
MRTTINLDERLLEEVVCMSGEKDKGRAVNKAMEEYVRRAKIGRMIELAGHVKFSGDWDKRHALELKLEKQDRQPRGRK